MEEKRWSAYHRQIERAEKIGFILPNDDCLEDNTIDEELCEIAYDMADEVVALNELSGNYFCLEEHMRDAFAKCLREIWKLRFGE